MARTLKQDDHAAKRNQILDVTQRLIYSRGYEQMTVQHILRELNISKGAFYHYFDSKPALLEALIERIQDQVEAILLPIVHDPQLSAPDKLQRFFDAVAGWKTARKDFLFALLRVWYTDDNALARQKVTAAMHRRVAPWLATILRSRARKPAPTTPEQAAHVVLTLMVGLGDAVATLMLALPQHATLDQRVDCLRSIESVTAAYTEAIDLVLGMKPGSLRLFRSETMREWLDLPQMEGAKRQ
jgi:AcrR family transcriptional regulator